MSAATADDAARPRILYITMMYPTARHPLRGGTIVLEVEALRAHADVTVVAPYPFGIDAPPAQRDARDVYAPYLSYPGDRPILPKMASIAVTCATAAAWLWRSGRRWDLVVAINPLLAGSAARRVAALLGLPYIVSWHGSEMLERELRTPGLRARMSTVLRRASTVIVNGAKLARAATELGVDRARIATVGRPIAPALLPARLPDTLPDGRYRLLTVAFLTAQKGHATVLQALARIREHEPSSDVVYTIIGDGPERGSLEAEARRLGVADRVTFVGTVPPDRLGPHYAAADLFVMPSWSEGFGLVYLEAMAHGVPVVGCTRQGPAEFVREGVNGFLVPPHDADAVAEAIRRARATAWDRSEIARTARTYSVPAHTAHMLTLFHDAISQSRGTSHDPGR